MPRLFRNQPSPQPRQARRALTAASTRVVHPNGGVKKEAERHKIVEWQKQAWTFYDLIGELRYGARYYGNSLSQMRLEIMWKASNGTKPDHIDLNNPPEGFDRRQYDIAVEALSRMHSADGSVSEILRAYGVNLFIAGEGYLVGRTDQNTGLERWDFYSTEQLLWMNGAWYLKENPNWKTTELIPITSEDYVIRVWNPHPRYSDEPDSPIRSILSLCEELLLLSANVRATALSRIPAGILLMPDTMLDAGPEIDPQNLNDELAREDQSQSTLEEIYQHFITPISDPNSAAAVAPFILTGDPEDLEQVRLIEFDREIDEIAAQQRKELLTRMAHGIDLPTEILNGMQSISHWTAWQIEESSYKSHIRPAASLFCGEITSSIIWPAIQVATGQPADQRLIVGFDPIDLISHIDRRMSAKDGHAALVISDATYRRALGFGEDDAPDDDEYVRRMAVAQASLTLTPIAAGQEIDVKRALDEAVERTMPGERSPESVVADPDPRGRTPNVERDLNPDEPGDVVAEPPAVTASAATSDLGDRLVAIDKVLMDRLELLATAAMRRTLEKAGARIRSRISREEDLKAVVAGASNFEVPSLLGEAVVASLFANEELLLSESFEDFKQQYDSLTARAQKQVRNLVASYGLDADELEAMEWQQEVEREAGWVLLAGLLTALAAKLLYKPKITSADVNGVDAGEFDDVSLVPASLIRAGLSAAGGNVGIATAGGNAIDFDGRPLGLVGTGETANTFLSAAGVNVVGYRWVYGEDTRITFEPHLDLDGYEFSSWEDAGLSNPGDFPDASYLYPGDHDGCRCLVEYLYSDS